MKPPPSNSPQNSPPPPPSKNDGKGDRKGQGYGGYGTYGDYGSYGGYGGYGAGGYGGSGGPGYGGYYYGYGYGYGGNQGGGEPTQNRNIRDYLLILRERIWWVILTFLVIFGAFILYLVNATPEYIATASLRVNRTPISPMITAVSSDEMVADTTDFNTRIRMMETRDIAQRVADRFMTDEDKKAFLAPFKNGNVLQPDMNVVDRLLANRSVQPGRLAYIMQIGVQHPDPQLAAKIADYFAEAFIDYNSEFNVDRAEKAVEQLEQQAKDQNRNVENIQEKMTALVNKYGLPNLDPKSNIMPGQLTQMNTIVTQDRDALDRVTTLWQQVQDYQAAKRPLWELSAIANNAQVSTLKTSYDDKKALYADMSQSFGERHPDMIKLTAQMKEVESQLTVAVDNAAQTVKSDYENAKNNLDSATAHLNDLQKENQDLSNVQVQYDTLSREKDTAEQMHKQMLANIEEQRSKSIEGGESYSLVDRATGQVTKSQPKTTLLICGGLLTGLTAGIGIAFLVAFLDDRIKSAFDIESFVGLPLIGILPRIAHLNANEKAQAVASNADRRITEAFRSIYSSLKLNDASKNARVILVTSTVPSEGKSFMTTNLALTYAMHAERVLLVDCDLRMPNIAKSLNREGLDFGLMTHLKDGRPFEECIVKDFYPGLDVMPTGGRTNNPTQIFNSREFADFVLRMRQQYDRVFIDSPPLGAVSDALNLLPNVDGVLYVIKFNAVKRKVAKINLSRLMQGNVPVFGAILNQISLTSASYYYTHYYDKSYHNYYMNQDIQEDKDAAAAAESAGKSENGPKKGK